MSSDDREALSELRLILIDIQAEDVDDPEDYMNQLACNPGYVEALNRILGIEDDDCDDDIDEETSDE